MPHNRSFSSHFPTEMQNQTSPKIHNIFLRKLKQLTRASTPETLPLPAHRGKQSFGRVMIMAIGGAEDKIRDRLILRSFVKFAGGSNARILVIPTASGEPVAKGEFYCRLFEELGAKYTEALHHETQTEAAASQLTHTLEQFSGVFLSGGDQSRLSSVFCGTPLLEKLRHLVQQGKLLLAGTSAGAAVMGHHMIAGGGSGEPPNLGLVELDKGFGMLPHAIMDQHFHNRNRLPRLMSAVAQRANTLGIGVDEDTCALINLQGQLHVIGKGTVTILDAVNATYRLDAEVPSAPLSIQNLCLHILQHGDSYKLPNFAVSASSRLSSVT
jgi:cyanophycinase